MPIYEYECSNCHHQFDAFQKFSDPVIQICERCSQATAQRLISATHFQLKGSGWYQSDYKPQPKSDEVTPASPCKDASGACKAASSSTGDGNLKNDKKNNN